MKQLFLVCSIFLIITGCSNSALQDHLKEADEISVNFYDPGNKNSILKIVKTSDEKAIEKLINFIDEEKIGIQNCGFSGILIFSKSDRELQRVNFNTQNNCSYFSFVLNNDTLTTKMNNEAADFLNALYSGRNFY